MAERIPKPPEDPAHISALIAEHQAISRRLHAEADDLAQLHPHQWAGMNSDLQLTIANSLSELLAMLRPGDDQKRNVAVQYLDQTRSNYCSTLQLPLRPANRAPTNSIARTLSEQPGFLQRR